MEDVGFNIEVNISEEFEFNKKSLSIIAEEKWIKKEYPVVYLIKNDQIKRAYVGESTNGLNRIKDHLANKERRKLNKISIIGSDKFNKSATLEIESKLIQYISSEGTYKLQNGNGGHTRHNYYQKDLYQEIFIEIWKKLKDKKIVSKSLRDIENTELFKYSPYKSLNVEQYNSVIEIIEQLNSGTADTIVVNGEAGTGKTILAVYLIKLLISRFQENESETEGEDASREFKAVEQFRKNYPNPKIVLVIAMSSLRKTLKNVFAHVPGLSSGMVVSPSKVARSEYDIAIVDEAHRLRRRKNISWMKAFSDTNKKLGLGDEGTELDWIMMKSKCQIFFYDPKQSIRPSDIPKERFDKVFSKSGIGRLILKSQMRLTAGEDYTVFTEHLLSGEPNKLASLKVNSEYDFFFFESFIEMREKIIELDKENDLCRCIAGYSWPWVSKRNPIEKDIELEGVSLHWNIVTEDWIRSPASVYEIGCIHTTMGYDLNYAGIVFGKEIVFNPSTKRIEIIRDNYFDTFGKRGASDEELKQYILNIYRSMMHRGMKGTFIYASDPHLANYLKKHVPVYSSQKEPFKEIAVENLIPFVNAIPVYDLEVAAGNFNEGQDPNISRWVEYPSITPHEGDFICRVVGESMNKIIPNKAWCFFRKDEGGSREGKIVLVQHRDIQDPDFAAGFTVKEYSSNKIQTETGWEHEEIILKPKSYDEFNNIVLSEDSIVDLRVVGVFHSVLE